MATEEKKVIHVWVSKELSVDLKELVDVLNTKHGKEIRTLYPDVVAANKERVSMNSLLNYLLTWSCDVMKNDLMKTEKES